MRPVRPRPIVPFHFNLKTRDRLRVDVGFAEKSQHRGDALTAVLAITKRVDSDIRLSPIIGFAVRLIAERSINLRFSIAMQLLAPIELSSADKLEILQRLDRYRKWHSLEDKRYCLACGQIIEGRDVLVVGGTRGTGPLRLICPTRNCHSIPMDWVIPTDQVLARMSMLEEQEALPRQAAARPREKFSARVRRFATQFRPAA